MARNTATLMISHRTALRRCVRIEPMTCTLGGAVFVEQCGGGRKRDRVRGGRDAGLRHDGSHRDTGPRSPTFLLLTEQIEVVVPVAALRVAHADHRRVAVPR